MGVLAYIHQKLQQQKDDRETASTAVWTLSNLFGDAEKGIKCYINEFMPEWLQLSLSLIPPQSD